MIFEPPDKKGNFLLVDTFKKISAEPTRIIKIGETEYKLFSAERGDLNSSLNEFADENFPETLFLTEEYVKKIRRINYGKTNFARYIPLRENDTRKYQLDVACGYVEDNFYRVKKISEGFHPVYTVETADLNKAEFSPLDAAQSRQKYYSAKGNFIFAQVDLAYRYEHESVMDDGTKFHETKYAVEQPTIYEPERGKFYRVVPVQIFDWDESGFQKVYCNGIFKPVKCSENKFYDTDFFKRLRWSKLLGWVLYEKISEELSNQLLILRGYKSTKEILRELERQYNNRYYDDGMSDAELLGYAGDYDSDLLWELNGF